MNAKKPRTTLYRVALFLGMLLLFLLIGAGLLVGTISPAIALEQELRCGMEEHIHTDGCYNGDFLTCETPAHSHNGNCYIVLLGDNDINNMLNLMNEEERSLEAVIDHTVTTAQTLQGEEDPSVAQLNATISQSETLPDLVLNENINTYATVPEQQPAVTLPDAAPSGGTTTYAVGDTPSTGQNKANFYLYLDRQWTCIGTLSYTRTANGNRYNYTIPTADVLGLVNGVLGTNYDYNDFDLSASTSLNSGYSSSNLGMNATTAIIAYREQRTAAQSARYVRLIPYNGSATSTAFSFYTVTTVYPDGSETPHYLRANSTYTLPTGNYLWLDQNGNSYTAGETVTITNTTRFTAQLLGPITHVSINYEVNFPTVSGVTVSTAPTMAGLSSTHVTDGFSENTSAVLRNVSNQTVEGKVNGNNTGLSRIIQFRGWQVNDSDVILQPNTTLVWDELLQYANGASLTLRGVWDYAYSQTASFFIRFDSVAVDTEGNITGQDSNLYTKEVFASYVGGIDTSLSLSTLEQYNLADVSQDNSFTVDREIRALYGERSEGVWLGSFPGDEQMFEELKQYAETGHLSVDGEAVAAEDLNAEAYAIRWYVFKVQSDAWHIDGKLVKKEGSIELRKTFAGNQELIEQAKEVFAFNAVQTATGETQTFTPADAVYDAESNAYIWEISPVEHGDPWQITEIADAFTDSTISYSVYPEYTVLDTHGGQSTAGSGFSVTVYGVTKAIDEGDQAPLTVSFNNIYNRADSIIIKKQDHRTGSPLSGAAFRLLQNDTELRFSYNTETNRYLLDGENGTETILRGTENGYFEICVDNLDYSLGPITVQEHTAPDGYTLIGDIQIGHTDEEQTIGILTGDSEMVTYNNGILVIGNTTDAVSVTAQKEWECAETEWQPVTVQLLANGVPSSAVVGGIENRAVLSADNNWQYTWEELPLYLNGQPVTWTVREIAIGEEQAKADGTFVNWLASYDLPVATEDENGQQHLLLKVTNTTKRVMLRLTKTDLYRTTQLPDAVFRLEAVNAKGELLPDQVVKTGTTNAAGVLVFDNMKCDVRYRLTEITAPEGYHLISEPVYCTIREDGAVEVEKHFYAEAGTTAYNILIRNAEAVPLPESGGGGTAMYYALGLLFFAAAAGVYIYTSDLRRWKIH